MNIVFNTMKHFRFGDKIETSLNLFFLNFFFSFFFFYLFSKGIITIGDLLSDAGIFLKGVKVLNENLSPIECFNLMSIVDAIPLEWRQMIRQNRQHI